MSSKIMQAGFTYCLPMEISNRQKNVMRIILKGILSIYSRPYQWTKSIQTMDMPQLLTNSYDRCQNIFKFFLVVKNLIYCPYYNDVVASSKK